MMAASARLPAILTTRSSAISCSPGNPYLSPAFAAEGVRKIEEDGLLGGRERDSGGG